MYYSRCAKNFVIDTMSRGGLYIAGGIASKNRDIFSSNEAILTEDIKVLRESLYKTAERILKKNSLTVEEINVEDFELGSIDLIEGKAELLSRDGSKTYFFSIVSGEIFPYTTYQEKQYAKDNIIKVVPVPDMKDYIQFMKLPPF